MYQPLPQCGVKDVNIRENEQDHSVEPMNHHTDHQIHSRQKSAARHGIAKEPSAEELFSIAYRFDEADRIDDALWFYQKAIDADPNLGEAHYNMGIIYKDRQALDKAIFHFKQTIALKPNIAESYSALAIIYYDRHQYERALSLLEKAVSINPRFGQAHYHMGVLLQETGRYEDGLKSFETALACNPDLISAPWRHLLSLPMVYDTREQIDMVRQRYTRNLDELVNSVKLDTCQEKHAVLEGIRTATNFYLQYQGRNDLILQKKYGRLVHDTMSALYPQWRQSSTVPPPRPGEPIRIGYVSSFMCHHTIGAFLWGWISNHDPAAVEIYGYHVGYKVDDLTAQFSKACHRFHHLPANVAAAANQITSDGLHVLVYSDIGMNIDTLQLAAMRLAPVQCKGWGHPVTTGLPTMDYYLSSDLMEPDECRDHYSETLIRLPNLALCYSPPELPPTPMRRERLSIAQDRFVFLSTQSIYKYLPQHDDIYPLIAKQAPHAVFVFINHQSRYATQRFRHRLRSAFARHHLDGDRFCYFAPRMDFQEFLSLNMMADVLLDTFDWSGGKTTLEGICCGLPVVTCPGRFMRGRHAYAMLTMMGVTDTIARDADEYCQIAVRLATDGGFYHQMKSKVSEHRHLLYNDRTVTAELENFYRQVTNGPEVDAAATIFSRAAKSKDKGIYNEAIACYRSGIEKAPAMPEAHYQLGLCYLGIADPYQAAKAFRQAITLSPENEQYWFHTAEALLLMDKTDAAVTCYRKVIELAPDWDAAHYNLAVALRMSERIDEAIHHAQAVIRLNPDHLKVYPLLFRLAQHACDWNLIAAISKKLDAITGAELDQGKKTTEPPLTNIRRKADTRYNMAVARSWSRQLIRTVHERPALSDKNPCVSASERLRIGYLSADFKDHAVAYQIRGLLEQHDRQNYEIFGYACNPDDGSRYRKQMAAACDHFVDVHRSDNQSIAKQIQADGIHILVDMSGHSKNNRLGIAAMRPAPVQVSYLGFLSTTGADFIDYVFADKIVVPPLDAGFYTEKIVYLPDCYQANDDFLPVDHQMQQRSKWHLPEDAFVFCCFNQPYKIDADLFRVWMNILKQVRESVLWLVERSGPARKNLCRAAYQAGIDPSRLIFTRFVPLEQNLARLTLADLALDTKIYNGGATTSNALWSGVPVLTILGGHWVSRMSASAMLAVGLPELITGDLDAYEKMAVDLARNPDKLRDMQSQLRRNRSTAPLFGTSRFTRHVEKAYAHMWERFCKGLPAISFEVEP